MASHYIQGGILVGALRTIGRAVFVAGLVYFAIGIVYGGGLLGPTAAAVSILASGLFLGPGLVAFGLGLLYVSARRRERAAVSA